MFSRRKISTIGRERKESVEYARQGVRLMKSYALAAVLSSVIVTGSAWADADNDFRALGQVSDLTPMSEEQLADVEGGNLVTVIGALQAIVVDRIEVAADTLRSIEGFFTLPVAVK
jgi:hypothetical protein